MFSQLWYIIYYQAHNPPTPLQRVIYDYDLTFLCEKRFHRKAVHDNFSHMNINDLYYLFNTYPTFVLLQDLL